VEFDSSEGKKLMTLPHGHDAPRSEKLQELLNDISDLGDNAQANSPGKFYMSLPDLCETLATIRGLAFEARREIHNIWERASEPERIDLKELGL
jgi:hypothetical protein